MTLPAAATERLDIRPWAIPDDLEAFHAIWGDPEVIWWGPMADPAASLDLMRKTASFGPGLGWAAVRLRATGAVVGNAALQPTPGDRTDVEVGWHFARAHWGKGYATEAAQALVAYAFSELGLGRVVADIVPDNHRSRAVARRLGMHPEGTFERAGMLHDIWVVRRDVVRA